MYINSGIETETKNVLNYLGLQRLGHLDLLIFEKMSRNLHMSPRNVFKWLEWI